VGYSIPEEIGAFFRNIFENVPNIDKARISVHNHNDLGLCTANTLSAVQNGVRQVEVTINGVGERAGNTSLEEVVMAIKTRKDFLDYYTDINTEEIYRSSKLIERVSGMPIQWNKAIVGKNAFRHSSGIHQDGILKKRETWEIMNPDDIGIPDGTQIVIGKLSGRHAFRQKLQDMGYELTDDELQKAFNAFKALADKKSFVDDRDIEAIADAQLGYVEKPAWTMELVQVASGNNTTATATLKLVGPDGTAHQDAATGSGPIDAVYQAMNRITGITPNLTEFSVKAVTEGIDAQGEVTIRIEKNGRSYIGRSAHTDIIVASARAYTNALNRLVISGRNKNSQPPKGDSAT
jgi:2-isopropylmalate synthase